MSDEEHDHGVKLLDVAAEIEALRAFAIRYANAIAEGSNDATGAGLDLETAAVHYVRKLDEELQKAKRVDYRAIAEQAERQAKKDRERSDN